MPRNRGYPLVHYHELRLYRAVQHLESLETELHRWLATDPVPVVKEFDAKRSEYVFTVHDFPRPPVEFGLIIGDLVHNVRAALDNLTFALAQGEFGGVLPTKVAEKVGFPIAGDRPLGKTARREKLKPLPAAARKIVEDVQPYKRGDAFRYDPLWWLRELSNIDKHRALHLTFSANVGFKINPVNCEAYNRGFYGNRPLEGRTEIARIFVIPEDPSKEMDVEFEPTFEIAFERRPPGEGNLVLPMLGDMISHVSEEVIRPLEAHL